MSDSVGVRHAILEQHIGKNVTVVLGKGGEASVFNGVLREEKIPGKGISYWSLMTERGLVMQVGTPIPVPETAIFFATEQLSHLIVKQETPEEAFEKIQAEQAQEKKASMLVDTSGQVFQ